MADPVYIAWAENGHIRKWDHQPFEIDGVAAHRYVCAGGHMDKMLAVLAEISALPHAGYLFANPTMRQVLEALAIRDRALQGVIALARSALAALSPERAAP